MQFNQSLSEHPNEPHLSIICKIAELILQTRLDVSKSLFSHLSRAISSFRGGDSQQKSISALLDCILPSDKYKIKETYAPKSQHSLNTFNLNIQFSLAERAAQNVKVNIESWSITVFSLKRGENQETVTLLGDFFVELILILYKLPLFSIYQKNKNMKSQYRIVDNIVIDALKTQKRDQADMLMFKTQQCIQRRDEFFHFSAKVSYLPSIRFLDPLKQLSPQKNPKKKEVEFDSQEQEDKIAIYTFYDPDLDFTFITSDKEDAKQKEQVQRMSVTSSVEVDDFQLLIENEDEDFLFKVEELLQTLSICEQKYLYQVK